MSGLWGRRVAVFARFPRSSRRVAVAFAEAFRVTDTFRVITPKKLRNATIIRDSQENLPRSPRKKLRDTKTLRHADGNPPPRWHPAASTTGLSPIALKVSATQEP